MTRGRRPLRPYRATFTVTLTFDDWLYASDSEDAAAALADPAYRRDVVIDAVRRMTDEHIAASAPVAITEADVDALLDRANTISDSY